MALDRLLAPSSIVIVGASERPSIGRTIVRSLGVLGYSGRVLPVHPRHETIQGHPCSRDIREIDGDIDVVAICLSRERVVPEVEKAVARGVGANRGLCGRFRGNRRPGKHRPGTHHRNLPCRRRGTVRTPTAWG